MGHSTQKQQVVIIGGGFGGLYAALHLDRAAARDPGIRVTLIDPQNFAVFTPMLHEVASGALYPSSIVVPTRQVLRHVEYLQAEATKVNLDDRTVTISYGLDGRTRPITYEHLLIAPSSQTRFPAGIGRHALGMKTIDDALLLRNWLIALLKRAEIEHDERRRRALLTIVVAGGGFSGAETIGAVNDFLRGIARHYRNVSTEQISLILASSTERLLPEFEPALGHYSELRLRAAGIDIRLSAKVAAFDGRRVSLDDSGGLLPPLQLSANTLVWTAGITPMPLIESLPVRKERGRVVVTDAMAGPQHQNLVVDRLWGCLLSSSSNLITAQILRPDRLQARSASQEPLHRVLSEEWRNLRSSWQ